MARANADSWIIYRTLKIMFGVQFGMFNNTWDENLLDNNIGTYL